MDVHLAAPADSALFEVLSPVVPTHPFNFKHGLDFSAAARLGRYCLDHGIDVMDVHSSKAHTLAWLALRHTPFTKLVVHRRVDYIPGKDPLNQWKYRSSKVSAYVAISKAINRILVSYGIKPERVHTVRSAATPLSYTYQSKGKAKAALAKDLALDPHLPWIGNASALTDQKDYPTLLQAVLRLKQDGLRFHCLIAGAGKCEKSLRNLSSELGLDTHVRFLGFRDDVADLLLGLDVLAISSAFEGLGTIILDALQSGCCVVGTSVGGIPEIISHGTSGLLSPSKDVDAFAENLKKAISSDSYRRLLADAGKRHVEQNFSVDKMVEGNIEVYQGLWHRPHS